MPRARSRHAKAVQSAAIAAGVLAGKSTSQIAAELGVTARRVRQLIAADETRQIVTAVINDRLEIIVELFDRGLEVIGHAMRAKQRTKDGTIIGPDHYARLAAVSKLIQILTAGRPTPKAPEPKRGGRKRRLRAALQDRGRAEADGVAPAAQEGREPREG